MRNRVRRWVWCLPAAACLLLAGCQPALFPDRQQRTPFERFQLLHGDYRPKTRTTEFGAQVPDLRARLRPLEETY